MSLRRRLLVATAAALAALALALAAWAASGDSRAIAARRALTFFMLAESMAAALAPLFGAAGAARRTLRGALRAVLEPLGWTLAAASCAPLLLVLLFDRGAFAGWLLAVATCAAAGAASAGLVLALARLTRRATLTAVLAAALVMAFALQPLYTMPAIRALGGRPTAQRALIALGVRAPWMAAAYALKRSAPVGWDYDPLVAPSLYPPTWVGTDYPVAVPGPAQYLAEYLFLGLLLGAAGALRGGRPPEDAPDIDRDSLADDAAGQPK
jgi:hypothetical protein